MDIPELQNEDNDKTVEELLAELGPDVSWDVGKTEKDQINDLLNQAKRTLKDSHEQPKSPTGPGDEEDAPQHPLPDTSLSSGIDISVFQPEPESEPEDDENGAKQTKTEVKQSIDEEADAHLQKILDELNHERTHPGQERDSDPPPEYSEDPNQPPHSQILDLPSPGQKDLPASPTNEPPSNLAARFSSLSLPSAPTTPPIVASRSSVNPQAASPGYTDEAISTWCIICNDDATLQCEGCDGDLYCTNCWMEGHRSKSAGFEERRHKALQYSRKKGKGIGKVTKKVALGA